MGDLSIVLAVWEGHNRRLCDKPSPRADPTRAFRSKNSHCQEWSLMQPSEVSTKDCATVLNMVGTTVCHFLHGLKCSKIYLA